MCFCNSAVSAFCSANDVKNKRLVLCPSFVSLPLVVCVCETARGGDSDMWMHTELCRTHKTHREDIYTNIPGKTCTSINSNI